ncbi:type II toxin-antitoxin system Phd/YefM family antitoxin [Mammaliicoccus sp. G-M28]|uniref:type II toxin-antitoxin system Phd/YefM family antitoxin n=1 Tax=Mammaliicoccus sp. G-M28 TaxID=2898688 RepID=UPI001EFB2E1D|nr:type II toxin-antitoxin system Phd/YefM family antitoxin [Mammaliicoccus sp. G-M28]
MTVRTYSYARNNFRELIDKVNNDNAPITITTNEHNAVLISESDYNVIMETLYLQQNPSNARHLSESIADVESGNTVNKVIDVDE